MNDAFSAYHPAVNFLFFVGAIGCGTVFQHPLYLAFSIVCSLSYYLYLGKSKVARSVWSLVLIAVFLAAVNPLFNTQGVHILFYAFGRPYTLESFLYGCALAGVLLTVFLWFGCYSHVMTGDKFTALFGNLLPALSLLLVMVFRLVPNLIKKTNQITGARRSIGRGDGHKLYDGMTVLGTLVSWALEGGVVTADSMRARGYGTAQRQSFLIYRMQKRDYLLTAVQLLLLSGIIVSACIGQANAVYTPSTWVAPPAWGTILYCIYLSIPLALNIKTNY